jgi:hypothetical protein
MGVWQLHFGLGLLSTASKLMLLISCNTLGLAGMAGQISKGGTIRDWLCPAKLSFIL